jgi:uncharacterized phiE125 gp8 family phage protein
MNAIALAGPAVEPVSVPEMRAYLRLDTTDEDGLLALLIPAARLTVERATRLALIEQSWRVTLEGWPSERPLPLPLWPALAITAVRVRPVSGPSVVLDAASYRLDRSRDPARVLLDPAMADLGIPGGAVEIDASFGFGASPAEVPAPLKLAIQRLVAFWFEQRGDERPDGPEALPAEIRALLAAFVRPRLA